MPRRGREGRRDVDGRLQPPLRSAFRAPCARRSTTARSATVEMVTITSRDPGAAAARLHRRSGGIFRDMTIHDFDMARFLLGEEPVEVTAHRLGAGRQEDRRGRRFRQRQRHARNGDRQAVRHLQFAPRHLWLRPAHRGAWLEGHGRGREPARRCRSNSPTRRAIRARRCTTSS